MLEIEILWGMLSFKSFSNGEGIENRETWDLKKKKMIWKILFGTHKIVDDKFQLCELSWELK